MKNEKPPEEMLENMPHRNKAKDTSFYFYQDFKIACPNVDVFYCYGFSKK
jgi:hypothetical protein